MTHDELLAKIELPCEDDGLVCQECAPIRALRAVVELHRRDINEGENNCRECYSEYPCKTIRTIEKELK